MLIAREEPPLVECGNSRHLFAGELKIEGVGVSRFFDHRDPDRVSWLNSRAD